jgi:hypothetical protein
MGRWMGRWRRCHEALLGCALCLLGTVIQAGGQDVPVPPPTIASPTAGETVAIDSTAAPTEYPQRDLPDVLKERLLHRRIEPGLEGSLSQGIAWTIFPTMSYNPVYGFAIGASVSGGGKLGTGPAARSSALSVSGNYSTTGQLQVQFKGDIFSASSDYLVKADVRYLDTSRSTWGLGPMEPEQQEYPMEFKLVRTYGTLLRRTGGSVYVGFGYHLDDYTDIVDKRAAEGDSTPFTEYSGSGVEKTRASGFSINVLGDTRDDIINPSSGYFVGGFFRDYLTDVGSDRNWQEFWTDVRMYPRVPARSPNVLAFWIYTWMTFGPAPYLNLPAIGWDTYGRGGRGYLQGQIRGPNQTYVECEYRRQLTRDGLLGAVAFVNMTATTSPDNQIFGRVDKGGGVGLRIKLNTRSRTNLAIDRGWGEGGSGGWFLGTTEVF